MALGRAATFLRVTTQVANWFQNDKQMFGRKRKAWRQNQVQCSFNTFPLGWMDHSNYVWARGHLKSDCEKAADVERAAAVTIQRVWRQRTARLETAALKLQRAWRQTVLKRCLRSEGREVLAQLREKRLKERSVAALQRAWIRKVRRQQILTALCLLRAQRDHARKELAASILRRVYQFAGARW